jgi:transcriptional regulator with XRE-family HTH domain
MQEVAPPTPFARNLRALRKGRDLSQEALARELNVTFATVSRWERGRGQTSFDKLAEIAEFFGVQPSALLSDEVAA